MRRREASVKPAYADWYPRIRPSVWHDAAWVAEVLVQERKQLPLWSFDERVPSNEHFDFQGQARGRPAHARTRRGDV